MSEIEIAFKRIGALVKAFQSNESHYKSAKYSEAEARKDFIDKLCIALGWDVNHEQQTNPYEQEVKVERGVATGSSQRRADYAFYLAPKFHDLRFFVEAKKPFVEMGTKENYFQLIRYSWNSETPLAVLTDFEQFHILDCRYKPDVETALNRCLARYHYTEYAKREKFAEIYWLFSREAVASGSLEKRAKELPRPRGKAIQRGLFAGGYQSIDESFLAELDEYRTALARSFKNRNPKLDSETLTELTQRTLDRLVFLRFLEDKGIEAQRLVERFGEKGTAWEDFIAASRRLDGIYNGIVYRHHDILDSTKFRVDEDAFADICENLAHINSPYDFNAIPIHILGSIYERFLGKVIVATDKRVKVEEKPDVRKAGGIYYTPEYIVRYIVNNTVGKLIAGKKPDQIAEMRFADIACGSGSFLLGVFDLLLNHHGHYYNDNPGKTRKGDCIKRNGKLYLSLRKKREILLKNIYGVDIDAQAVEVCQLSLYLKLLQEETEASAHQYLLDFEHTALMKKLLPDLSKNIVCGNSLIGTDILDGQLFASDEERKLNPMNFEDAFPEVMKRGGFDAVIGNPPYGAELSEESVAYLAERFKTFVWRGESYLIFVERAIGVLKSGGMFGYIIPDTYLNLKFTAPLRSVLLRNTKLKEVVALPSKVFRGATVDTTLLLTEKADPTNTFHQSQVAVKVFNKRALLEALDQPDRHFAVATKLWHEQGAFNVQSDPTETAILEKTQQKNRPLSEIAEVLYGIKAYQVGKGNPPQTPKIRDTKPFTAERQVTKGFLPFYDGKDIGRYEVYWRHNNWIKYGPWLAEPRKPEKYESEKILIRKIVGETLIATYIPVTSYCNTLLFVLKLKSECKLKYPFVLGLLNSRFIGWYFRKKFQISVDDTFPQIMIQDIVQFPVPIPEQSRHDEMIAKVEAMLVAKQQLAKGQTDKDKTYYENKCAALDRQIDRLVYELYGLTEEEIKIVERTT
jgi:adenine-specific DNA-methyltransferase